MKAIRNYFNYYYFYQLQSLDTHQLTKYKKIEIHMMILFNWCIKIVFIFIVIFMILNYAFLCLIDKLIKTKQLMLRLSFFFLYIHIYV